MIAEMSEDTVMEMVMMTDTAHYPTSMAMDMWIATEKVMATAIGTSTETEHFCTFTIRII
jgi:hypothetical protein